MAKVIFLVTQTSKILATPHPEVESIPVSTPAGNLGGLMIALSSRVRLTKIMSCNTWLQRLVYTNDAASIVFLCVTLGT